MTLKEIMAANPGISIPEAVQRLNAYNTAAAAAAAAGQTLDPSAIAAITNSAFAPNAPGQQVVAPGGVILPPSVLQAVGAVPGTGGMTSTSEMLAAALSTSLTPGLVGVGLKTARELYIGNLPPGVTVPQLADFLNTTMKNLNLCGPQGTVISAW